MSGRKKNRQRSNKNSRIKLPKSDRAVSSKVDKLKIEVRKLQARIYKNTSTHLLQITFQTTNTLNKWTPKQISKVNNLK